MTEHETRADLRRQNDSEPDIISTCYQPRVEAILNRYELGVADEESTVRWMMCKEVNKGGDIDVLIKALIRICKYRAEKMSWLAAFDY